VRFILEIAKFILTAIGTFISVSGLGFAVLQFWIKKRAETDAAFQASIRKEMETERKLSQEEIQHERVSRKEDMQHLEGRITRLEKILTDDLIGRISKVEGELKGMRITLEAIQRWFIEHSPTGGK
jgi:5-bromo-4-chloroindolyl phosphate hydrolysis protein